MLEISWLGLREAFSVLPSLPSGLLVPLSIFLSSSWEETPICNWVILSAWFLAVELWVMSNLFSVSLLVQADSVFADTVISKTVWTFCESCCGSLSRQTSHLSSGRILLHLGLLLEWLTDSAPELHRGPGLDLEGLWGSSFISVKAFCLTA